MATVLQDLIDGVREDLVDRIDSNYLTDTQVARAIASGITYLNGRWPDLFAFTLAKLHDKVADTNSTVTPEIDAHSKWGAVVRAAAIRQMVRSGALGGAEKNLGTYSAASHSASTASIPSQHRLNLQVVDEDLQQIVASLQGRHEHGQDEVDFTLADY